MSRARLTYRGYRLSMDRLVYGEIVLMPLVYREPLLTPATGFYAESKCYEAYYDIQHKEDQSQEEHSVWTCGCGIHGYVGIDEAAYHVQGCKPFAIHSFGLIQSSGRTPISWPILAAIAQWGKLDQFENVVRSEYAQVLALFDPQAKGGIYDPIRLHCPDPTTWIWGAEETVVLERACESAGLAFLKFEREKWLDPQWVRAWAEEHNLIPQADMVKADGLLSDLETA